MSSLVWKTYKCTNAMKIQKDISSNMRAILIDWLFKFRDLYQYPNHYIHRAVKFIDIYLEHKYITKENLQKLGCVCLALVDLFFSDDAKNLDTWSKLSDNAFSTKDLIIMLNNLIIYLDYSIFIRTYYDVLKIKISGLPEQIQKYALFIADYFLHIYNISIDDEEDLANDIIVLATRNTNIIKCKSVLNALEVLQNTNSKNIYLRILFIKEKNPAMENKFINTDFSDFLKNSQPISKKQNLVAFKTTKYNYINYNDIKIGGIIGGGAYGCVSSCEYNNEKFAIKQFFNDNPSNTIREIVISRSFNHPNILSFSDATIYYGNINILMNLGKLSLHKWIYSAEYSTHNALKFIDSLIIAITEFHSKGFIHRDIKSENIIVFEDDIKIADFGCSSHVDIYNERKTIGYEICTLWYRAPEILLNANYYNQKADVWSLGCVIVEILNKWPILQGLSVRDQLYKIFKMFGSPVDCFANYINSFPYFKNEYEIETILNKASVKLSNKRKDILLSMFEYDPLKRPTMNEIFAFWFNKY